MSFQANRSIFIFVVLHVITSSLVSEMQATVDQFVCPEHVFTSTKGEVANDTHFKLYTRNNRNISHVINTDFTSTLGPFSSQQKNVFICHGYFSDAGKAWVLDMKNALLDREDVNVWTVDWAPLAAGLYPEVVGNVRYVGLRLAEFIMFLSTKGLRLDKCHLIGHSLGAHLAGFAGEALGGKVARISAMDAAGPLFQSFSPRCRVDKSDAVFVDAMHTNVGQEGSDKLGIMEAIGHVDFYFNGGSSQPGCYAGDGIMSQTMDDSCSHQRVHTYYTETVKSPNTLIGYKCTSYDEYSQGLCVNCEEGKCAYSGYNANNGNEGIFHVSTRKNSPYTGKIVFVIIKLCPWQMIAKGRLILDFTDSEYNLSSTVNITEKPITLHPSMTMNVPAVLFPNLTNIDSGAFTFSEEFVPVKISATTTRVKISSICIESIKLIDSETKNQCCYKGGNDVIANVRKRVPFTECS